MTRIPVALFNYQDVGFRSGTYDFRPLQHALSEAETPALILFCEGRRYRSNGGEGLYWCAEALSDEFGVPYIPLPGTMRQGPMGPVIFYNPDVLIARNWWDGANPDEFIDKRNIGRFAVRDSGPTRQTRPLEFLAWVQHWDARSGDVRYVQAGLMDRYGNTERLPVIGGGDLNASASGDHLPQRDWMAADYRARSHKGRRRPDGTWVADTRAVDHLIGEWVDGQRVGGCGYHAMAEIAWRHDPTMVLEPTVNTGVDAGGGLLIDWLLVNDAMRPYVDPGSYRVHVPVGAAGSDHRAVTGALNFTDGGNAATRPVADEPSRRAAEYLTRRADGSPQRPGHDPGE
jgi:hypothetical protein